ncbi:type I secretion system permease/ATPase [Shewanella sp. A25]|nr:type I secretion system permease/ATPase [Shewanella shenzhenensis]
MSAKPMSAELTAALKGSKRVFTLLLFFSCVINMLMLAPAIYMLQVYDRVLASQNTTTLLMLTLLVVGLYVLIALIESARASVMIRIGNQFDVKLNQRVFDAAFKRRVTTGDHNPAQALTELTQIRQFLSGNSLFAFFDLPWIPVYLLFAFIISPLLGYLTAGGILVLFTLALVSEIATNQSIRQATGLAILNASKMNKQMQNSDAIEAMGMLPALKQHWITQQYKVMQLQTQCADKTASLSSASRFVRILLQSIALGAGALLVIAGDITPGLMIAASIILGRALNPVEQLIGSWKQFVQFRSSWQQLSQLLKEQPETKEVLTLPSPTGNINVENLFAAPPGQHTPILRNISLRLAKGEALGVIGPSASGKTSLAKLLVGVWSPLSGKVRIDGADINQWDKALLGPAIGYLPQDVELFDGSIAQNIARFGAIDSEAIVEAAQLAGVHEMILRLPQGYDTLLGPGGYQLSGGQKQRIGLARAVYKNPAFIVLDEPNANLDDAGEFALVKAIQALKKHGQTTVIISHRPTLLGTVDKVLLLKDGAVQEWGDRDEVFAKLRQTQILKPVSSSPSPSPSENSRDESAASIPTSTDQSRQLEA